MATTLTNIIKCLVINITVLFAFRIEVNDQLHSSCEVLAFRPSYKVSETLQFLNLALTKTVKYPSNVLFIVVITDGPLDMMKSNFEFGYHYFQKTLDNISLQTYVSRQYTPKASPLCSITLTTFYHMVTRHPGEFYMEDQYSQFWGSWLRRSLQSVVGLLRFSVSHVILGLSTYEEDIQKDSKEALRDTQYSPPFVSYIVILNTSGNIRGIRRLCVTGCNKAQQMYQINPLFVGVLGAFVRDLKPIPTFPRLLVHYHLDQRLCYQNNRETGVNKWYCRDNKDIVPFIELAAALNFSLTVGHLTIGAKYPFDGVFKTVDSISLYLSTPTYLLSCGFLPHDLEGTLPIYCSSDRRSIETVNILVVLFRSLDPRTWLILVLVLLCVYHYVRVTSCNKSNQDLVFEIVQVLLQRTVRRRDFCRISLLVGCFFIEFLYLTGTTEHIIVPRGNYFPKSMIELIQNGYKWYQGSWTKVFSRRDVAEYKMGMEDLLLPELKKEGFTGDHLELNRYWVQDMFEDDYQSTTQFLRAQEDVLKHLNSVTLVKASSAVYFKPEV